MLQAVEPALAGHTIVRGLSSAETIIGSGADDASDVLDRRVDFKGILCQNASNDLDDPSSGQAQESGSYY
jgi:hypothetical protein